MVASNAPAMELLLDLTAPHWRAAAHDTRRAAVLSSPSRTQP
jgi:hypothetical protein